MNRILPLFLVFQTLAALCVGPLHAGERSTGKDRVRQEREKKSRKDAEIEATARRAMESYDIGIKRQLLAEIRDYRFRLPRAKEREYTLFAMGLLENAVGNPEKAVDHLRTLERLWPKSPYLIDAQDILGHDALVKGRLNDGEARLRRALDSDMSVEDKRRIQESLLWACVMQGSMERGLQVLNGLYPLSIGQPSERGLAAMVEVQAFALRKEDAAKSREEYLRLYPEGPHWGRVELAYARLLGLSGDMVQSAGLFQQIITRKADSIEADEARLALATILAEGKLKTEDKAAYSPPKDLLGDIRKPDRKQEFKRRTLLVKLRVLVGDSQWKDAMDLADSIRRLAPLPNEEKSLAALRAEAFRSWTRHSLDLQVPDPILPYLNREGVHSLNPDLRMLLAKRLTAKGIPNPAILVMQHAPDPEKEALRHGILESILPESHPQETRRLLTAKKESAFESLRRAQAALALKDWPALRASLANARPGDERIGLLCAYLRRPPAEDIRSRLKEAEEWHRRAGEKGEIRLPLTVLVADLRAAYGDYKGAYALYPQDCGKDMLGWVTLMRATCLSKLGKKDAAKELLKKNIDVPGFKMERETLGKQLGK